MVLLIRFQLKFVQFVVMPRQCVGSLKLLVNAVINPWLCVWRTNFLMLQKNKVLQLRNEDVHRMAEANKAFAHYRW